MTRAQFESIRPRIIEFLSALPPLDPYELLEKLTAELQIEDSEVRNVIWRLIDDGDIRLTHERKFAVALPQG